MKEKNTSGGHMLYADYVVPVYNLDSDARHLAAYSNSEEFVDVWGVKATLGNEFASMQASLQRAENTYRAALENSPHSEEIRMNMVSMKHVREFMINPKYHQFIDTGLKLIIAKYLRANNLKTDLDHAKYLQGFSIFNCFKEALR